MANIKELIQSIESGDSSFDEKLAAINQMEETLVAMREQEQEAVNDNVELIVEAIKLMEKKVADQLEIAKSIVPEKGDKGDKGQDGLQGRDGLNGKDGRDGQDGKNGLDGSDGVSVTDAKIDFDGSLIITLSTGREINVGEVVAPDLAERLNVISTMSTNTAVANITSGTIDNTTIGGTTPSTGVFTTLTAQTELLRTTGNNLFARSQTFNGTWTAGGANITATDNAVTAPDATTTAANIVPTVTNGLHRISNPTTLTLYGGVTYTSSIYAKANGYRYLFVNNTAGIGAASVFDLQTGTVSTSTGSATITSAGSGWYRCTVTGVAPSSGVPGLYWQINNTFAVGDQSFAGDGTSSIYFWGGQLEIGSSATTYVPTTTAGIWNIPSLSFGSTSAASIGLQSDGSLYETSAGTGNVRFYTNNIAQEQARVSHTASAVNYHQLTGSATGSGPIHSVAGSDTNIDLNLTTKGSGKIVVFPSAGWVSGQVAQINLGDAGSNLKATASSGKTTLSGYDGVEISTRGNSPILQLNVAHTASAVNYLQVTGGSTGNAPYFISQGSDTNVNLWYGTKGTGYHAFFTAGNGANVQFLIANTASAVNYVQTSGSTTGFGSKIFSAGSDTNIPLVLQPKGTGALQAQQTDSTATGGNARGANAVDWQTARDTQTKVASGQYSALVGGYGNLSSAFTSFAGGGYTNNASGYNSVVVGGTTNTSSGAYSAIVGGVSNTASKFYNFVGSGQSNTAAGYYNFIGGGFTNSGTSGSAVTTQSGTMNATTAVTLSGSNANIKVGQYITGTSIADETYVAAISGTSLTLSKVASGSSTSTLSFFTPHGVVVGGGNNQATGSYSFIGGGGDAGTAANRNVASGDWSTVSGGIRNQATGYGAIVCGGADPFFGGANVASGQASSILGGANNTASGYQSSVLGGTANTANGAASRASGLYAFTRGIAGAFANGYNGFGSFAGGTCQYVTYILQAATTDATPKVATVDGSAGATTNQVIMSNNSAYFFTGEVVAGVTGGGNTKGWTIEGVIKRGANAASTALVGTPTVTSTYADAGASTWVIAVTADTTNGGLAVTFTGQLATTIRVVCQVRTTEMTF